jgi:COP9 signalosome complex subunit 7
LSKERKKQQSTIEIEEGQAQVIQKFVNKASTLETTSSLANLIVEATSHPSLFAFSEILSLPNILQVFFSSLFYFS